MDTPQHEQLWLSGAVLWRVHSVKPTAGVAIIEFIDDLDPIPEERRDAVIEYIAKHLLHTGRFESVRLSEFFPNARLVAGHAEPYPAKVTAGLPLATVPCLT